MGELVNLTGTTIPEEIARDAEFAAADAAHVGASDPHAQYLLQSEGDTRYEYRAGRASKSIAGPLSFPANTWSSLGPFPGFPLGAQGDYSAVLIALNFLPDISLPWQQSVCAGLMGFCWWQPASTADMGIKIPVEVHNLSGFYINIRAGLYSGDLRAIMINPEISISIPTGGRVDALLKKLN